MSDFSNSTDREIHGYNLLVGALIFLSVVVGIALLADTSPNMGNHAAAHVAQVTTEQAS
ncbi:MAG TPA: hypothetical protein VMU22_13180 [Rhizomicrobium sp.]|nr:hypothetical protein [Rhizomicrobium sp.]